jgi:hypothetical protein
MENIHVNGCSALGLRRTYALGIGFHSNLINHANSKLGSSDFFNEGPVEVIAIVRHENPWRSQSDFQQKPFNQCMFTAFVVYMKLFAILLRHRLVGGTTGRYSVPVSGRSRIGLKTRIPAHASPRGNRVHRTSDLGGPVT